MRRCSLQEHLISRVYRGRSGPLRIDPITIAETGAGVEKRRKRARLDSAADVRRLHRRRAFPGPGVSVTIQPHESVPQGSVPSVGGPRRNVITKSISVNQIHQFIHVYKKWPHRKCGLSWRLKRLEVNAALYMGRLFKGRCTFTAAGLVLGVQSRSKSRIFKYHRHRDG